jgi:hypothetical protein
MRHELAFLHTLASNVETFDRIVTDIRPASRVRHVVAEELLREAREGGLTDSLTQRVQQAVVDAASTGAGVVVCSCSTIGGAAEATDTSGRFVAMRIDRPMADKAVRDGQRILVAAALVSTLAPTRALLEDSARRARTTIQITELIADGAWPYFERGDRDGYARAIARSIRAGAAGADVIVLAQASMAPAADLCADVGLPILTSPRLGVQAALDLMASSTR